MSLRNRAEAAPVARLATVDGDGRPHLVPCCFAFDGDVAYSVVDHKPKRSPALRRLDNIRSNPAVCLLVDHYEDDWSALWWVELRGTASTLEGEAAEAALDALATRYPAYLGSRPPGPVIAIRPDRWAWWSAR